eukprot:IDg8344t1
MPVFSSFPPQSLAITPFKSYKTRGRASLFQKRKLVSGSALRTCSTAPVPKHKQHNTRRKGKGKRCFDLDVGHSTTKPTDRTAASRLPLEAAQLRNESLSNLGAWTGAYVGRLIMKQSLRATGKTRKVQEDQARANPYRRNEKR